MPVYHFRLTDIDTGEFRNVSVAASSKEEAEATIMRQEQKKVDFHLDSASVVELEKRLKEGTLSGRDKARLFSHKQGSPYVIQKAKED